MRPRDGGYYLHTSYLPLPVHGSYGIPAMAWYGNVKPSLFEMSVPQFFITAPRDLPQASDSEEGATTESLQKSESLTGKSECQDHSLAKMPAIPILLKKDPVKVPNICWKKIFKIDTANSFALFILQEASFSDAS
jgi:hypothetical protein